MKKFLVTMAAIMTAAMTWADKPVVYVDYFYSENVPDELVAEIQANVLAGLSDIPNIQVVDVNSKYALSKEDARRSAEAAMSDATARAGEMKQLGADYLIEGDVSRVTYIFHPATENVEAYYSASFNYTIRLIKSEDGTNVETKTFEHGTAIHESATGKTEHAAFSNGMKYVKSDMKIIAKKHFKMNAQIIESDYVKDKKGKAMTECYINIGSADGIAVKAKMSVSVPKIVLGNVTYSEAGEIQVDEVVAPHIAHCKVTKGGDVILKAMEEYISIKATDPANAQPIIVETKEANAAAEGAKNFFGGFIGK